MAENNDLFWPTMSLIMIFAIVFMVVAFVTNEMYTQSEVTNSETFTVSNPDADKTCTLGYELREIDKVEYYNGTAWTALTLTTDYTVSGDIVTVKASAMT